jgi:hypothetical protein
MARRYSVAMRVAYLVHFRGGRDTGIYRKVREHVTEPRVAHDPSQT